MLSHTRECDEHHVFGLSCSSEERYEAETQLRRSMKVGGS